MLDYRSRGWILYVIRYKYTAVDAKKVAMHVQILPLKRSVLWSEIRGPETTIDYISKSETIIQTYTYSHTLR